MRASVRSFILDRLLGRGRQRNHWHHLEVRQEATVFEQRCRTFQSAFLHLHTETVLENLVG